jgi:uncharacterized protein (TIGR03437 family)
MPNVFLNGQQMQVPFSALAPGAAGLWQIDIAIPGDGPTGSALPLVVESWLRSNSIPVAVSR